ncbi:MAG: IS200/IS605 family transposase [Deltaproteobacteria bacterium]|jgi:putative transposase|nr:IS200/IS605 family transposase [Deltaproteobacteria bacterium]
MKECLPDGHSDFLLRYHIAWVTKNGEKVLTGDIGLALRDIIRRICAKEKVDVISGRIAADHVRLFLSAKPNVRLSELARQLKGKTSHFLLKSYPSLQKRYWEGRLWARGYFCRTSGNVTDESIQNYVESRSADEETFIVE